MDPFTTTLVAIVGLLANFVNEQRGYFSLSLIS